MECEYTSGSVSVEQVMEENEYLRKELERLREECKLLQEVNCRFYSCDVLHNWLCRHVAAIGSDTSCIEVRQHAADSATAQL